MIDPAELQSGERVVAAFAPARQDDLKPGAASYVGRFGEFEALFRLDDGDYDGEWAMRLPSDWSIGSAIWVPYSDLKIIAKVPPRPFEPARLPPFPGALDDVD